MTAIDGQVLRIFVGETDKHGGMPLYEWLLRKAKEQGLAGGSALRGIAGFGAHHQIHSSKILDISTNLPIVVEIIDTAEKIAAFMPTLDEAMKEGLAVIEPVTMRVYR